jgi:membrane-bound lytic murein transglycosylase A
MNGAQALATALALSLTTATTSSAQMSGPEPFTATPIGFEALEGWLHDDHGAALTAFRRTCDALLAGKVAARPAVQPPPSLLAACARVIHVKHGEARQFFEDAFEPVRVTTPKERSGFLTGYFEPEYEGSLERASGYTVPLLSRPSDLVTIAEGESQPGLDPSLRAARRVGDRLEPYSDRAAIEDGALGERAAPVVWLRSAAEAFVIHVQGSARIRLPDGSTIRVGYAGRNGHPFTAIGRILVERGIIPLAEMNLESLMSWLEEHPSEARDLMRLNRSYIFFRVVEGLTPEDGPIGGAGVPLLAGRSLAVDRTIWPYGTPVWVSGALPRPGAPPEPLARLMIAQDTGSAIVGPMRGDYFMGSGAAAGVRAGLMRQRVDFVVLRPRDLP